MGLASYVGGVGGVGVFLFVTIVEQYYPYPVPTPNITLSDVILQ